ncbi:MAG: metallophosphoesterase [Bradyrhizobium sp.]
MFSDLHADMADIKPIEALPGVDVVVVAGDVCEGAVHGFARLREIVPEPMPIVMAMGNHEYYHRTLPDELALARREAARFGVHLLENDAVVMSGITMTMPSAQFPGRQTTRSASNADWCPISSSSRLRRPA